MPAFTGDCPDGAVCLTPDFAVKLGEWVRGVRRYLKATEACPYVKELGEPGATHALDDWARRQLATR